MIKLNQIFRAAAVSLTIGGAAMAAGQASAYTYHQSDLDSANYYVEFTFSDVIEASNQYASAQQSFDILTAEYWQYLGHCSRLSSASAESCYHDAQAWYDDEYLLRSLNVTIALMASDAANSAYQSAVAWRDEVAADCCEVG